MEPKTTSSSFSSSSGRDVHKPIDVIIICCIYNDSHVDFSCASSHQHSLPTLPPRPDFASSLSSSILTLFPVVASVYPLRVFVASSRIRRISSTPLPYTRHSSPLLLLIIDVKQRVSAMNICDILTAFVWTIFCQH